MIFRRSRILCESLSVKCKKGGGRRTYRENFLGTKSIALHVYDTQPANLADCLEQPLRSVFPKSKIDIPKHLSGRVAPFRQYSCYAIPMCVVKQAIAGGDFPNGVDCPPPPMVLVIE